MSTPLDLLWVEHHLTRSLIQVVSSFVTESGRSHCFSVGSRCSPGPSWPVYSWLLNLSFLGQLKMFKIRQYGPFNFFRNYCLFWLIKINCLLNHLTCFFFFFLNNTINYHKALVINHQIMVYSIDHVRGARAVLWQNYSQGFAIEGVYSSCLRTR